MFRDFDRLDLERRERGECAAETGSERGTPEARRHHHLGELGGEPGEQQRAELVGDEGAPGPLARSGWKRLGEPGPGQRAGGTPGEDRERAQLGRGEPSLGRPRRRTKARPGRTPPNGGRRSPLAAR
jgi:hypothetical protein